MNVRVLALLPTLLGGCSFVFAGGPPAEHQQMPYFDCPSTFGLPVADGFVAASSIAGAVTTFRQSKQEYAIKNDGANRNAAGAVSVALATTFVASAIYGIVQANRCQAAKEQLKARIMEPILRPPLRPAPPPLPRPAPVPAPAPAPETVPPPPAPDAPPPG